MDSPIDLFAKLQPLVQNEARQQATNVYKELGTRYNVASVPTHLHNGIDSVPISESDVIPGNKTLSGLLFDTSETITLVGLNTANIRRIVYLAFAANNKTLPATKRAIINGEVQFGRCYSFSGNGTGTIAVETSRVGTPFVQICNAMYVDSTDLTKNRVHIGAALAEATDDSGSNVVSLTLDNYDYNSLTLTCTLATDWKLQGNLIIS